VSRAGFSHYPYPLDTFKRCVFPPVVCQSLLSEQNRTRLMPASTLLSKLLPGSKPKLKQLS
jgi:hypothetical protein